MANHRNSPIYRQADVLFGAGAVGGLTDGQLLERFTNGTGEAAERAFSAIVERHGSMVLRVCRTILRDPDESHDAFQATFLILLKKAGAIRDRESVASWLHGVAYRIASCSRSAAARRRRHELRSAQCAVVSDPRFEDLAPILHEELRRLPERYLAPIVLCHLQGLTHEQAAQQLGWPVGTVRSRLSRGRDQLRKRLTRRGLAPAFVLLGGTIPADTLFASLVNSTVQMAAGVVPPSATALFRDVLRTSIMTKLKLTAGLALAVGVLVTGVVVAQSGGEAKTVAIRMRENPTPPQPDPSVGNQTIRRKLDQIIDIDFSVPTPLEQVIKFFRAASKGPEDQGISIYVDPASLRDAGRTMDTPVTIVMKKVPFHVALTSLLEANNLAFDVRDGLLVIESEIHVVGHRLDRVERKLDLLLKAIDELKRDSRR